MRGRRSRNREREGKRVGKGNEIDICREQGKNLDSYKFGPSVYIAEAVAEVKIRTKQIWIICWISLISRNIRRYFYNRLFPSLTSTPITPATRLRICYTGCSLNIVFLPIFFEIFRTLAFLCFPSVSVCVHTKEGREPALQQYWQS